MVSFMHGSLNHQYPLNRQLGVPLSHSEHFGEGKNLLTLPGITQFFFSVTFQLHLKLTVFSCDKTNQMH